MRITHIVSLVLAALVVHSNAAEPSEADPLFLWKVGVLLSVPTQKQVCEEQYPQFKVQNEAAYRGSVFFQQAGDALLEQSNTLESLEPSVRELVNAHVQGRVLLLKLEPQVLYQLCEQFPANIERSALHAVGAPLPRTLKHQIR